MKRFFVDTSLAEGMLLQLSGREHSDEIKHMMKVMRLKAGDKIFVSNGQGVEATAKIDTMERDSVELSIMDIRRADENAPILTLCQAVIKGPKMDWLVEKITEIGVRELFPILSEHTVAANESSGQRVERWERIAKSAVKQSGALYLPKIHSPLAIADCLATLPKDASILKIVLHPEAAALPLARIIQNAAQPKRLIMMVGPEGGFSDVEIKLLKDNGFLLAQMGDTILRGESAGFLAPAIALHLFESKQ
jgi:16S rRNA (uracil1498-N3)-methyltransferase